MFNNSGLDNIISKNIYKIGPENLGNFSKIDELPLNNKFVIFDSTTNIIKNLVNLTVVLQKISFNKLELIFSETSEWERWSSRELMKEYYLRRKNFLEFGLQEAIDSGITNEYFDSNYMLIQYPFFPHTISLGNTINLANHMIDQFNYSVDSFIMGKIITNK